MSTSVRSMNSFEWLLLVVLSLLWGGSFLFVGVAVKVLTPLTIVALRVSLAATALIGFLYFRGLSLAVGREVWNALCRIKPGEMVSYAEIAEQIGSPAAIRAVARACATNKLAVVVPCHRVIYKNGKLSSYRWGIERKRMLLERERGPA